MVVEEKVVDIIDDKTYNDICYWIANKVINLNERPRNSISKQQNILIVDPDIVIDDVVSKLIEDLNKQNQFKNSMLTLILILTVILTWKERKDSLVKRSPVTDDHVALLISKSTVQAKSMFCIFYLAGFTLFSTNAWLI